MSNLLKLTTLTVLGLASLDQTLAAEAAAETGVGECLLRTGRGVTTPYLGNLKSGDEVPYSSRKPFPSLTQCYKFNTQACCVSGHDHKIKEDYGALLSPTCIREFSQLEYYMCLGCNSDQPKYVDDKKNVRICKKFADKLWTTDPTIYDTCGLNVPSLGLGYVLPSRYYTNASHFLNALKPPYFDDHTIVIAAEGETDNCLDSSAMSNMVSMVAVVAVSFASMLMM